MILLVSWEMAELPYFLHCSLFSGEPWETQRPLERLSLCRHGWELRNGQGLQQKCFELLRKAQRGRNDMRGIRKANVKQVLLTVKPQLCRTRLECEVWGWRPSEQISCRGNLCVQKSSSEDAGKSHKQPSTKLLLGHGKSTASLSMEIIHPSFRIACFTASWLLCLPIHFMLHKQPWGSDVNK